MVCQIKHLNIVHDNNSVMRKKNKETYAIQIKALSPLYSTEVMEEAMEPFSQSLSMFLLDALLSPGIDSMEHTDPALEDTAISRPND